MSTDTNLSASPNVDAIDTSTPARYIWAGLVTVLSLILACTIGVVLLGRGIGTRSGADPTPVPGSDASLSTAGTIAPGSQFSVRGSGFVAGETVDIYFAPSQIAPFGEYIRLSTTQAGPDGAFVADGLVAPSVIGPAYLVARGTTTGFTSFTPIDIEGAVPTQPTPEVPTPGVPTAIAPTASGPLPDLVIAAVSIELETGGSCTFGSTQLGTRVVVQNVGLAPAGPFIVQVNNQQQIVPQGLAPGAIFSLWVPGYAAGDTVVIVDPIGQVPEVNEGNNQFVGPLPIPTLPPTCTPPPGPTVIVATPTPNPEPTGSWFAQYFNNPDLVPPPVFEQNLNTLSINWGSNSPGPGVQRNAWSAIFNSNQNFATTDNYLFTLTVDGGARLYVDGALVIDEWRVGGTRTLTANRGLSAGTHQLRVEYFKSGTTARLGLTWKVNYSGWMGRYYNNVNREGQPALKRDDPEINFDWGFGSPAPEIRPDNFSVDWQRSLNLVAGDYLFTIDVDDGARLFIDNQMVINSYDVQGQQLLTATRTLGQGSHFFQVQYVEYTGQARVRFTYERLIAPPTPTPTATPTLPVPPTSTPTPTMLPVTIIVITDTPPPLTVIAPTIPLPTATWTLPAPPPPATDTPTPTATLALAPTETPTPTATSGVIIILPTP
jgi:hypothetical protein